MSVQQAENFVLRMKSDPMFRSSVLSVGDVEGRIDVARRAGFDCSLDDVNMLSIVCINPKAQKDNLPLSWQCKGPCHGRCADIVA